MTAVKVAWTIVGLVLAVETVTALQAAFSQPDEPRTACEAKADKL